MGVVGMLDPPWEEVKVSIEECASSLRLASVSSSSPETTRLTAVAVYRCIVYRCIGVFKEDEDCRGEGVGEWGCELVRL